MGILASTLANCHRGHDTRPFTPADFLPQFGPARPEDADAAADDAATEQWLEMVTASLGGVIQEGDA